MKSSRIIYLQALAIYLLLTLPAVAVPAIYMFSAMYAISAGLVALAVFAAVFLIIANSRPPANVAKYILITAVVLAVAAAYKVLLMVEMPGRSFWTLDTDTAFPILAVFSGWMSLAINFWKIKKRFTQPLFEGFETIFTYDKA